MSIKTGSGYRQKELNGEQGETVKSVMVENADALTAAGEILGYDSTSRTIRYAGLDKEDGFNG